MALALTLVNAGVTIIQFLIRLAFAAAATLIVATPAQAQSSSDIPEPSSLVLLGVGIAGLLIGRRGARKGSDD